MLKSIDLFSGLGGISHSLRGFVQPLAYCDHDPVCRATIEARIATGDLPDAPVLIEVQDTRAILAAVAGRPVDIIISSSSCVGFSTIGSRKGLDHPETELFLEVLDLLQLVKAPMLFMENVGAILTSNGGDDYKHILRRFAKMGYRVTWCVLTAGHVGGWHQRRRWFALAYKPRTLSGLELRLPRGFPAVRRFSWTAGRKPAERVPLPKRSCIGAAELTWDRMRRMKMLGNAVVPDCTRLAFIYLFSGGLVTDITVRRVFHTQFEEEGERYAFEKTKGLVAAFPTFGISSRMNGSAHEHTLGPLPFKPVFLNLRVNPKRAHGGQRKKAIKEPIIMDRYMTPRAQNNGHCRAATARCLGDLGTQTRFMRGVAHPDGHLNPLFVEFLMGYPREWTNMRLPLKHQKD